MDEVKIRKLIEEYKGGNISDTDKKDLLYYIDLYPEIIFYPNAEDALDAYNYKHNLIEKAKKDNRKNNRIQIYYAAAAILIIFVCVWLVNIYNHSNQNTNIVKINTKLKDPILGSDSTSEVKDMPVKTVNENIFTLALISNTKMGYSKSKKVDSITVRLIDSNMKKDDYKFETGKIEIRTNAKFNKENLSVLYLKFDNFTKGYFIYNNGILYPIQNTTAFIELKKEEDRDIVSFAKSLIKK